MEALEYERQLVLGDPDARVRDLEPRPAVRLPDRNRHLAPLGGVLDGVVQEYGDRLPDAAPVEGGLDRPIRGEEPDCYLIACGAPSRPSSFLGDDREVVGLDLEGGALVAAGQGQ